MSSPEVVVKYNNFSLSYLNNGGTISLKVLDNINLEIFQGEIIVIVGPSGSGKTTLLKTISGLLNKENKNLIIEGGISSLIFDRDNLNGLNEYGYAFQNPVLLAWRTVYQNIALPMERRGLSRETINTKIDSFFDQYHSVSIIY